MLTDGVDIEAANVDGKTLLHQAARMDTWILSRLYFLLQVPINDGAAMDAIDKERRTPLHWAAINGHVEVVKVLIDAGAAIDAIDMERLTPLHWAAINGHVEVAKVLIDAITQPKQSTTSDGHRSRGQSHVEN